MLRSSTEGAAGTEASAAHVIYVVGRYRGTAEGTGGTRARLSPENAP